MSDCVTLAHDVIKEYIIKMICQFDGFRNILNQRNKYKLLIKTYTLAMPGSYTHLDVYKRQNSLSLLVLIF